MSFSSDDNRPNKRTCQLEWNSDLRNDCINHPEFRNAKVLFLCGDNPENANEARVRIGIGKTYIGVENNPIAYEKATLNKPANVQLVHGDIFEVATKHLDANILDLDFTCSHTNDLIINILKLFQTFKNRITITNEALAVGLTVAIRPYPADLFKDTMKYMKHVIEQKLHYRIIHNKYRTYHDTIAGMHFWQIVLKNESKANSSSD
jgi:hypothetical protein